MLDWIGSAVQAIAAYKILADYGGLVAVLVAGAGYVISKIWRHRSSRSEYSFLQRGFVEIFEMVFFSTILTVGIWIWWETRG